MVELPDNFFGPSVGWGDPDLTDALVLMQPYPTALHDLVDGVERQDRIEYIRVFQSDIEEFLGPLVLDGFLKKERPQPYVVPPASGSITDFLMSVGRDVNGFIQDVGVYLSLGQGLISLVQRRRQRDGKPDLHASPFQQRGLYSSIRVVEAMCFYHAYQHYSLEHAADAPVVKSFARAEHVGAIDHPSHGMHYTIFVMSADVQYVYVTDATTHVFEHFKIEGNEVIGLPRPKWPDDDATFSVESVASPNPVTFEQF